MRQVSIPKNVVDALNELFDAHPAEVSALLECKAHAKTLEIPATTDGQIIDTLPVPTPPSIGVLDVVNAVLEKLYPGKRVAIIQGPDGLEGFTLARDRKPSAPQTNAADS